MQGVDIIDEQMLEYISNDDQACEGPTHSSGAHGHVKEQRAAWFAISPCGASWFVCDAWVQALMNSKVKHSVLCDSLSCPEHSHPKADHVFIKLGD